MNLSMWRRALPQTPGNYGWYMAKHEHMSASHSLTHAALVGHILRGTVLEHKPFEEAVSAARNSVGDEAQRFERRRKIDPYSGGPSLDEAFYPT